MIVNGKEWTFSDPVPLFELLEKVGFDTDKPLAVECNGIIIKKTNFTDTVIQPHDRLEVVCFVGGG